MLIAIVDRGEELLRRDLPVRVAQDVGELLPVARTVEPDANPSTRSHVGRNEEALRRGPNRALLTARRRLDPHRVPPGAMVIVRVGVHREHLVLHTERRLTPCFHFVRAGQRETEFRQANEWTSWHGCNPRE